MQLSLVSCSVQGVNEALLENINKRTHLEVKTSHQEEMVVLVHPTMRVGRRWGLHEECFVWCLVFNL